MGRVELPYVDGGTAIEQALAIMRAQSRCGLVTRRGHRSIVLTDGDLIDALRERGSFSVAEVQPVGATIALPADFSSDQVFQDTAAFETVGDMLRNAGAFYAIDKVAGPTTWVVTIAEGVEAALGRKPTVCRCRKNPGRHVYRPAQVASGTCSRDGEPVDCT